LYLDTQATFPTRFTKRTYLFKRIKLQEKFQVMNHSISGYAGYVKGIKPENLYANTFGKITLNVAQEGYVKGQDIDPKYKYVSTQQ